MQPKKKFVIYAMSFIGGFYYVFMLQNFWNWFLAPILFSRNITFWEMFGLSILVDLFLTKNFRREFEQDSQWKISFAILNLCVKKENLKQANNEIKKIEESLWREAVGKIFEQALGLTGVFILGWGIHKYLL